MTVIVETGAIVSSANSYVDEAELGLYALERGITITGDETILLIKAMDYLESLNFVGDKYTQAQSLQWPRYNVRIDGYYVSPNVIPEELKKAQMEIALSIFNGVDPQANVDRQKSSVKVGELAVTYEAGQSSTIVKKINNSLRKLLKSSNGGSSFIVDKG